MPATGAFIIDYFPLFLLGAIFGRLMDETGAAEALPGTLAIQNAIPMPYFGTTSLAAPGLGLIAAIIMASFGLSWLTLRANRANRQGDGYGEDLANLELGNDPRTLAQGEGFDLAEMARPATVGAPARPGFWPALAPILIIIAANYAFAVEIFPRLDTAYLADPAYGETRMEAVRGIWAIIIALSIAIGFLLITNRQRLPTPAASMRAHPPPELRRHLHGRMPRALARACGRPCRRQPFRRILSSADSTSPMPKASTVGRLCRECGKCGRGAVCRSPIALWEVPGPSCLGWWQVAGRGIPAGDIGTQRMFSPSVLA